MIPIVDRPEVIHGDAPILRINMAEMDEESIKVMLEQSRDGFYSNKELAPIREYSTNARDAHIQSGQPERPIEVTLPCQISPELKIRDFGNGLTFEAIADVYFRYWKSTKRNSNDTNGCLGIGAKSAFAYAPAYTIITWCEGMKTVATGQKNGYADVIYRQPKEAGEQDGVEVIIPVLQKDINKFIHEALEFFKFWSVRPIFHNIDEERLKVVFSIMDTKPILSGEDWAIRPSGYGKGESKAVMSSVPYTIDWNQVRNSLSPEVSQKISGIFTFLEENLTTIYFENGTLSFTPNRESLQYNDSTIETLTKKLLSIYNNLLSLITDKISDAANLWEAKIRYNSIFRKELDGFDKESIYGGNLNTLENLLNNRIQWNGIILKNGIFEGFEKWDKNKGLTEYTNNFESVLSTYVKNEDKTGIKLCKTHRRHGYNNKIVASPKSIVIIQDTDKNYLAKGLARWFLCDSGKNISQVYVLDLSNPSVKDDLFKEYSFDTVPVHYVSQNIDKIKNYLKTKRSPRGSGITEFESRPLNCPYVEIKNRKNPYLVDPIWNYEDVNARNLDGGGIYVVWSKNSFECDGKTYNHNDSRWFWQAIYNLAEKASVKLPKVYGIHSKSANAVWFKEAVEEGSWTPLSEWIEENIEILPKNIVKMVSAYRNTYGHIEPKVAANLFPLLIDGEGVAGKYFNILTNEILPNYDITEIPDAFRLNWKDDTTYVQLFSDMATEMKKTYPLLFKIQNQPIFSKETVKELADYINLVDLRNGKRFTYVWRA